MSKRFEKQLRQCVRNVVTNIKLNSIYINTRHIVVIKRCLVFLMKIEKIETGLKHKIVEACNLPKDAMLGYPITNIMGNKELRIENYRGILEYDSEMIRIQTKLGQIKILGTDLKIEYYANDEMKIVGEIHQIEFE